MNKEMKYIDKFKLNEELEEIDWEELFHEEQSNSYDVGVISNKWKSALAKTMGCGYNDLDDLFTVLKDWGQDFDTVYDNSEKYDMEEVCMRMGFSAAFADFDWGEYKPDVDDVLDPENYNDIYLDVDGDGSFDEHMGSYDDCLAAFKEIKLRYESDADDFDPEQDEE